MPTAVDLFCGAGGLTRGLLNAGINVTAGVDFNVNCKYAYEHNNAGAQFLHAKVEDVSGEDLQGYYMDNDIKVLVGCAPCQPFSNHTNKYKKDPTAEKDGRWDLLKHFARMVDELTPDIVSMENVPQIAKHDVFEYFVEFLKNHNYFVTWSIVFCPKYGIPQKRSRLVLLASKYGPIKLTAETHGETELVTVKDAIGNMRGIQAGESDLYDRLHKSSAMNAENLTRIKSSKQGGTWRDWDPKLLCECHKRTTGETYSSVYSRMEWNKPSPTITTQFYNFGTGRFGHPEQDRALSLREGAVLQTFPLDYQFVDPNHPVSFKEVGKMIGNAVPVKLGEIIGKSILEHLRERRLNNV